MAYNAKDQTSSLTPPGGSALAQSYTGATQIERVTEASTSFKYSTLGLMSQTDGSGTSYFTRDNTGLLVVNACQVGIGSTIWTTAWGTW